MRDTAETRRAHFAARVAKIAAGASCSRAWAGYSDERRTQIESECPDIAAELAAIRSAREAPRYKESPVEGCYLVQCQTTRLVKIGHSNDPRDRLGKLQVGSATRLELMGVVLGNRDVEATMHARYAHRRLHGEWFALSDEEIAEALRGCIVPEPGAWRRSMANRARAAARSPRQGVWKAAVTKEPSRFRHVRGNVHHTAHLCSWATTVGFALYSQKELATLCGVTQSTVSTWLRAARVKALKHHFFDREAFLESVFA